MPAADLQLCHCCCVCCCSIGGGVLPPPVKKTDRTSSADLSSLADYHLRINSMNARQAAAAAAIAASIVAGNRGSGSSDGRLRDALTARIVPKDSSAAAPVAVGATGLAGRGSNELLVASSAVAASANRLGRRRMFGGQSERSMIAPILEGEEASSGTAAATGSHDGSSESLEREKALSAEALRKHIAATSGDSFISSGGCSSRLAGGSAASNSSSPPRVRPASQRQRSGSSELPDSVMSSVCEDGRHGNMHKAPHGHLPQWMWPFAKDDAAAKEVTTDELMRQIGASGNDAAKLQQLCRGLLCERNDWRFKATQVRGRLTTAAACKFIEVVACLCYQAVQYHNLYETSAAAAHVAASAALLLPILCMLPALPAHCSTSTPLYQCRQSV